MDKKQSTITGYKPPRLKLAKTARLTNCLKCNKELPEPKRQGGRHREFCSEKCRVAFNRASIKSNNQIMSGNLTTEVQLMGYEKLDFSKETLDTLRALATYYPQSQAVGGKYPYDAAELAVNAIISEKKILQDKLLKAYSNNVKAMTQLQELHKELTACKEGIKRSHGVACEEL